MIQNLTVGRINWSNSVFWKLIVFQSLPSGLKLSPSPTKMIVVIYASPTTVFSEICFATPTIKVSLHSRNVRYRTVSYRYGPVSKKSIFEKNPIRSSVRPSVRLSVHLSVHPSVQAPLWAVKNRLL